MINCNGNRRPPARAHSFVLPRRTTCIKRTAAAAHHTRSLIDWTSRALLLHEPIGHDLLFTHLPIITYGCPSTRASIHQQHQLWLSSARLLLSVCLFIRQFLPTHTNRLVHRRTSVCLLLWLLLSRAVFN